MGVFMSLFKRVLSVVWMLMLLASCHGIPVSTDYEPERDYSVLKTYAWKEPMRKIIIDPMLDTDLMNDRIHRAVEARLTALGFSKALADEGADFFITFNISSAERFSVNSFHGQFGYHSCWNCSRFGRGGDITVRQFTLGALMLDVIDPASERLIWRGVGEKRIPRFKTPQERDLYIAEIVQAILDHFPPGKLIEAT
jgi:hypothetical protein